MADLHLHDLTANAGVYAILARCDAGGTGLPGKLVMYSTDIARGTHNLAAIIAEFPLRDPASGGAFNDAALVVDDIQASIPAALSVSAENPGPTTPLADWFAFVDNAYNIVFWDDITTVAVGTGGIRLQNTTVTPGSTVSVDTYVFKQPRYVGDVV